MAYIDISYKDGILKDNSKGTNDELDYILYKIFKDRAKTDIAEYTGFCVRENPVISNTNSLQAKLNDDKTVTIEYNGDEIDSLLSLYCEKRVKTISKKIKDFKFSAYVWSVLCFDDGVRIL